ncbi:GrpB family protein [Streptomyces sp. MP131-18]|uniref:GrpB family protein n=1 Tax=Streptomyces sp. MP131-18 TaxID=1857892 RepID=UPI00097BEFD6|nr:GrpB family protein [Streptomyces sp. MP131-18]ONK11852.1 dephospho-CoA kinase/protein folding accessory domain-containing protein [Streptomyces sp. MP131-18]
MPFPDEWRPVEVVDHRAGWAAEFDRLAAALRAALGARAIAVEHVGSTAVPGLPAKDCIDVQVRVRGVAEAVDVPLMTAIGFRCRPEPWNRTEVSGGVRCAKLVFAPPVGARTCNVHVRETDGPNARFALLFRDYLRADADARRAWGAFKQRLSATVPDWLEYGQIKAPATEVLMGAAEHWAAATGWQPPA